jgi:hypothetical protein
MGDTGAGDIMEEVGRLRELAERCLRLARSAADTRTTTALNNLAAEAEVSATQREEKLQGGQHLTCRHQA